MKKGTILILVCKIRKKNIQSFYVLVRENTNNGKIIFINLKEYIKTGNRNILPSIEPNDTVIIEPTILSSIRGSSIYLQTVLSITTIMLQIINFK